jgi:putative PEP-CTERM system histidine kinase
MTAALFSAALALAALLRRRRSLATWCFFAGMSALAVESVFGGMALKATHPEKAAYFESLALVAKAFWPGFWLAFSLSYSRGNYLSFLATWKYILAMAFLLPIGIAFGFHSQLVQLVPPAGSESGWALSFGEAGKALNVLLLIAAVIVLNNLEKTFRSTVGTMRWRIKFMILGLAVIFAARIYTLSQKLLFSKFDLTLIDIETGALFIGCALITISYFRNGISEIDVYPSHSVLQGTVTVLLSGGYLFAIGLLAQIIAFFGAAGSLKTQALVVLLGIAGLATLLLSDRVRQKIRRAISRHFQRPQHDSRKIWLLFTQRMSGVLDRNSVCSISAKLISETFNVLSVTVWCVDEQKGGLAFGASTALTARDANNDDGSLSLVGTALPPTGKFALPFDLEEVKDEWAENLKKATAVQFRKGGNRICLPLTAAGRWLGCATLADRVNGLPYTVEEMDLLKCIGDQIAAVLLNLRLTNELMMAKELEAFQTMSAFFVHDLKNATSSLGLTLQNLRVHFDDPQFREDALRGISNTLNRINLHIGRLSALRTKLELKPIESDLNQLVIETLEHLNGMPGVELTKEFHPLQKVVVDREQIQNVVTNLLLNAREAVGSDGKIRVETVQRDGRAVLSITDNGCGMSPDFLRNSLFRPFQTTKKKGLGIGMFQSKLIIEAHRGSILVESELGKGTKFGVYLPLAADGGKLNVGSWSQVSARRDPSTTSHQLNSSLGLGSSTLNDQLSTNFP